MLGADIEAPDNTGQTPLAAAVGNQNHWSTRVLLEHGASGNVDGGTPLLLKVLATTRNANIVEALEVARLLLAHGQMISPQMRAEVARIGSDFEFYRADFNPEFLDETDAALAELYGGYQGH